ncbi:MAG TPA: TIM barrel protein [Thermodesulfobacteriota bacterium]|nr:TIM barrel protein [Thermodesulfobacteriota bacterium]
MAKIRLGVNNGFALKNWPEPEEWAKIIAGEFGLKEVQFSFDLLDPTLPEPGRGALCREIRAAAAKYELSLRTTFTGLIVYAQNHLGHPRGAVRSYARKWFEGALEVTSALGAEACGGHIGAVSAADYNDMERRAFLRKTLVDSVRELTWVAAGLGQKYFLWELMPTPREFPHTPEEALDLMREANEGAAVPVRICFDLGHCSSFDLPEPGDPHAWLEKILPWTPVVHLQQTDGKGDHHWPFTPEHAESGIVEPRRVVEIVKASPLERVDLIFELGHALDAPDHRIIDDHKRSVEAWAKWM